MKKMNTLLWTLFTINGLLLSFFIIMNDKQRIIWLGITYFVICLGLQYLNLKEEKENSLKYIRR